MNLEATIVVQNTDRSSHFSGGVGKNQEKLQSEDWARHPVDLLPIHSAGNNSSIAE
jgi:hypothetical protein